MIVEAVVYGLDLTDRLGLELWRRTVRDLDQLGLLARSDGAVVLATRPRGNSSSARWQTTPPDRARLAERRAARALIGFLTLRDASLLVRQLGAELGLSPAASERVPHRAGGHVVGGSAGRHVGGGWLS